MTAKFEERPDLKREPDYYTHCDELVKPYLTLPNGSWAEEKSRIETAMAIGWVLSADDNDEAFVERLRRDNKLAAEITDFVRLVKKGLKEKFIKEDAPWYRRLQDKMLRFSIYAASAEVDSDKGKKEISQEAEERDRIFAGLEDFKIGGKK